jgi:hypothetical protein
MILTDSMTRHWMSLLDSMTGRLIEWPQLLRSLMAEEYARVIKEGTSYGGKSVFIDRDGEALKYSDRIEEKPEDLSEELLVYRLYLQAHKHHDGLVLLDQQKVWLISLQVPNQGKESKRCADLLGLREDGSLVVFECKAKGNRADSPLKAICEGVDYLSHLMIEDNLCLLRKDFEAWRDKHGQPHVFSKTPHEFNNAKINNDAKPAVVVLAPQMYYNFHRSGANGNPQGWEWMSDRCWLEKQGPFKIDFAVSNFKSDACTLLELKNQSVQR